MSAPISVEALSAEGQAALERLVVGLADSKRIMGIRYSDWVVGAPSIETGIATSSMTQDEWGHARLFYAMLKHLGVDPVEVEHNRGADEYANLSLLDKQFENWAALVTAMVVLDGALSVVLRGFAEGTFEPAGLRVPKMLAEEQFHVSLGFAWYRRLAAASDEARSLLRDATDAQLPATLAWLGADDAPAKVLVELGVMPTATALTTSFQESVGDVLASCDVDVGAVEPASDWDSARGRGTGRPDAESVERARGDRNRSLFVE